MSDIWSYRTDASTENEQRDLSGYDVEATDGHIGKIDESELGHIVVDTGFWIFGKKRLIPAGMVVQVDDEHRKVFLKMTKDEVKNAPDLNDLSQFDDAERGRYSDYYSGYGR
jgi:hypothetical protein